MKVLRLTEIPIKEFGREKRAYYFIEGFDRFEIVKTDIPPHHSQPMHMHRTVVEATYVIDGRIVAIEDGEEQTLGSGDVVFFMPNRKHTLVNREKNTAHIITVKSPRSPSDKLISST